MALTLTQAGHITTRTDADLVPGGDKDTSYQIRHITIEKFRELTTAHTDQIPNRRTQQREERIDLMGLNDAQLDFALLDWTGVLDSHGAPLPCTRENKMLLDAGRRQAICGYATANDIAPEVREESFRAAEDVR